MNKAIQTQRLDASRVQDMTTVCTLLQSGGIAALPTETVYGLAANALNRDAVNKIFTAKGRPNDNPLIVHIAQLTALEALCKDIPAAAYDLAEAFWPGPLTMVLPKKEFIPDAVTAGLSTVAVRLPAHPIMRDVIARSDLFLAAPSANRSGRPSPTTADHVWDDLNGRIDAVLDGGPCDWGVESTVIDLSVPTPALLRPGGITLKQLTAVLGTVSLFAGYHDEQAPKSPGMKYTHYAPACALSILDGRADNAALYVARLRTINPELGVLCPDEEASGFAGGPVVAYGSLCDPKSMARGLFAALRKLDELGLARALVRVPEGAGLEVAIRNRLYKAAGQRVVNGEDGLCLPLE